MDTFLRTDWEQMRQELNRIHERLLQKPDSEKLAYQLSFGSILNAYREGDISFAEAIDQLDKITSQLPLKLRKGLFAAIDHTLDAFFTQSEQPPANAEQNSFQEIIKQMEEKTDPVAQGLVR